VCCFSFQFFSDPELAAGIFGLAAFPQDLGESAVGSGRSVRRSSYRFLEISLRHGEIAACEVLKACSNAERGCLLLFAALLNLRAAPESFLGLNGIPLQLKHLRQSVVRAGSTQIKADGFAQSRGRHIEVAFLLENWAEHEPRLRVVGPLLDGGTHFLFAGGEIPKLPQHNAEGIV
jgi:hypothetical protein